MYLRNIIIKLVQWIIPFFRGYSTTALQLKALKSAANAVVITDTAGRIEWVNTSFLKLTGYTFNEAKGNYISKLVKSGMHGREFYQEMWDTILSGKIWKGVITNRRKDGTLYTEQQTITPVTGSNGAILNFISIKEDISEKVRIEEALKESEKRLDLFFKQSLDGFFFMMLDEPVRWDDTADKESLLDYVFSHQRITNVNQAMVNQYGGTIKEFIGLTPGDFYRHDISYGRRIWKDFFDCGRLHIETEERKFDGTPMYIEGDYICLYEKDGRIAGNFGIQRDITDRKNAEYALKQKSEELERFFTVALDLLCIADTRGNFIRVNRAWERTLGYSIDELEGRSFMDFVHPDDVESTKHAMSALTDQIPILNFTNRYRTLNGEYRYIEWRSFPSGQYIYAAARDITERINYESELSKLAERLTLATGSAGIGIWDWDILNNEIIWDRQMYSLYGVGEVPGIDLYESWKRIIHPADLKSLEALFMEGVKKLPGFSAEFRIIRPDGTHHFLEGHALVVRDENGRAVRITGVTKDITASKKMEEKLLTLSTTDPLTSAFNRRYFMQVLDSEISRTARYNTQFSLIMFDIDHFKSVNDTYGHDTGDLVLKGIVGMMQKRIRKNDVLARWGGEEFMILLSGTGIEKASIFADMLIDEVRGLVHEKAGTVSASFGVTGYRLNETSGSILKRVDELVYRAKSDGRNCIRFSA